MFALLYGSQAAYTCFVQNDFYYQYDSISNQKMNWLNEHGVTWKPNFVPGKRHKYKYATPDALIIDDTLSVIQDWHKAGGFAIWHNNALSTISQLKMYV